MVNAAGLLIGVNMDQGVSVGSNGMTSAEQLLPRLPSCGA